MGIEELFSKRDIRVYLAVRSGKNWDYIADKYSLPLRRIAQIFKAVNDRQQRCEYIESFYQDGNDISDVGLPTKIERILIRERIVNKIQLEKFAQDEKYMLQTPGIGKKTAKIIKDAADRLRIGSNIQRAKPGFVCKGYLDIDNLKLYLFLGNAKGWFIYDMDTSKDYGIDGINYHGEHIDDDDSVCIPYRYQRIVLMAQKLKLDDTLTDDQIMYNILIKKRE